MSLVLQVDILGEYKNLTAATKGAQTQLGNLNKRTKAISSSINRSLSALGFGLSIFAIANFTKEAIAGAEAARVADQRLLQITKSMNIFGDASTKVTADLAKFADTQELLTGVTAETTKQVQATLMTFKGLATSANSVGGNFERATKAALDLAAAGFGSAETNAIQLGKALNDPIKGLTALSRSGVTFTEQEKERIKVLVESNKLGEAQALILEAIETQVGGTAEATVTASARMTAAFGQIQDAVGLALLPVLDQFSTWLATPEGQAKLQEIITGFTEIITEGTKLVQWVMDNKDWLVPMVVAITAVTTAWKVATAAVEAYKTVALIAGVLGAGATAVGAGAAVGAGVGGFQTEQNKSTERQAWSGLINKNIKKTPAVVQNINIKGSQSAEEIAYLINKYKKSNGQINLGGL